MLKRATLLLAAAVGCGLGQHSHTPEAKATGPAPLLSGLGHLHHAVTTSNPEAQRYFDQGLTLIYAFNHDEAARSFRYAAVIDPQCAMAYWGVALAVGPNYNDPDIDLSREKAAVEAIRKALAAAGKATENEQGYIHALAKRYSTDPKADRKQLGLDYKQAMGELMRRFPDDLDAAVIFAESAMDLHPWQLWKPDGQPAEGTLEILEVLRGVLQRAPDHIGANHYYIHATEASPHPELATQSAERLKTLAPAAGHLVHMPAHTYIRLGDYHAASVANEKAAAADEVYVKKYNVTGMYPVMYYSHNLHFLAVSSSMEGNFSTAHSAAERLVAGMQPYLKENPMAEWFVPTRTHVLVRFRRWAEIEKLAEPDQNLHLAHTFWLFARGMAFSGTGQPDKAVAERDALVAESKTIPAETQLGFNSVRQLLDIAAQMLDASIARSRHDYKQAEELLNKAAQAEDALNYDEPPDWYLPPRESLGGVLFVDGRYAEAEAVFRAELKAHPKNPRALFGLAECLTAQGKNEEAAKSRAEFEAGWKYADTKLKMADL
jgi:tetratricopeptide (TPR) repeat protein